MALSVYLSLILDDPAQNLTGGLDLTQIDALHSDLASDVAGTLQNAAETVVGGPMNLGPKSAERRHFIGGSDARIIMGADEAALVRLWQENRGEVEPEDLSGNLIVQLGVATEGLNRRWYEATPVKSSRTSSGT